MESGFQHRRLEILMCALTEPWLQSLVMLEDRSVRKVSPAYEPAAEKDFTESTRLFMWDFGHLL